MIRLAALRATPRRTTRAAAVTAAPAIRRPAVPLAYPRASRRDRSATARQHCVTHWQTGFGKPSRANPARQHRGRVVDEALCASKSRIVGIRRDDVQSRRTVGGRGRIDYQVGQLENGRVGAGLGTRGPALLASPALAPLSPASSDARPALPPLARPAAGVSSTGVPAVPPLVDGSPARPPAPRNASVLALHASSSTSKGTSKEKNAPGVRLNVTHAQALAGGSMYQR